MPENNIELSIVIPFYKGERYIPRLLASLAESMKVVGAPFHVEVIVIIDSMDSDTAVVKAILSELELASPMFFVSLYKNNTNLGVAMSRNAGKRMATGKFITFIDQDDYVDKAYFGALKANLSEKYDFFLLNGLLTYETNNFKREIFIYRYRVTFGIIACSNFIITPGIVVMNRSKVNHDFRQVSEKRAGSDDWAFYLEMLSNPKRKYRYIMDHLFYYVVHEHNFHHGKLNFLLSQIRTIQHFQRLDPRNLTLHMKLLSLRFRLKLNLNMISVKSLTLGDLAGFLSLAWIELTSINNIIWLFLLRRSKRNMTGQEEKP